MFPLLEELDMGLVAFSPLANGLLTKCYTAETRFDVRMDYRAVMPQFQMKSFEQNESLFSLIDRLAEKYPCHPVANRAVMDDEQTSMDYTYSRNVPSVPA